MVSPKRQNLGILLPTTPPTVFPEWIPILHCNLGNLEELSHIFFNVLFRERDNWAISSACLFPKIIKVELEKVAKWEDLLIFFFTYVHTILFWYSWSHHVFFIDWFNFINIKWRNSLIKCPINLIQDFENLGMKSCVFITFFQEL